jgi:hypothetical protein
MWHAVLWVQPTYRLETWFEGDARSAAAEMEAWCDRWVQKGSWNDTWDGMCLIRRPRFPLTLRDPGWYVQCATLTWRPPGSTWRIQGTETVGL